MLEFMMTMAVIALIFVAATVLVAGLGYSEEVSVMLEFITMIAVMALVFCAATVFVALVAGGLLKARQALARRSAEEPVISDQ
jgi:hypothetical protein